MPVSPSATCALLAALAAAGAPAAQNDGLSRTPTLGRPVPELEPLLAAFGAAATADDARAWRVPELSWTLLAFAGNGATLRSGAHKDPVKHLTRALRERQQESGAFVSPGGTFDRYEHVLGTFAMARMRVESNYKLLDRNVDRAVGALGAAFAADDAPAPTPDETALLAMLAVTLEHDLVAELRPDVVELVRRGAAAIEPHVSRRSDAIRHLAAVALGDVAAPDLTVARCWPGDLAADALHTWLAAFAVRGLPERVRRAQGEHARGLLGGREADGRWAKDGDLDAQVRSAMFAAVLGMLQAEVEVVEHGAGK